MMVLHSFSCKWDYYLGFFWRYKMVVKLLNELICESGLVLAHDSSVSRLV